MDSSSNNETKPNPTNVNVSESGQAQPVTLPTSQESSSSNQPVTASSLKPKSSKLWIILLIALLLAVAGGYLLLKHKDTAKPKMVAAKRDIPLIRYGTANGPVNVFYPSQQISVVSGQQEVNTQLFEGLVAWQNGTKLVPLLATSWTNPDDSTWIFNVRQGVKFHTGNLMTAADVKYSLDNFKDSTYDDEFGTTIKSVTVVSPYQVKITTNGPDPLLLNRLVNLYIVDSKGTKPNDPVNGTGPFVLKPGAKLTPDYADLVAFDGYWDGHVYTRELQFDQILNESDEVAAMKNHHIDIFDDFIDTPSINELKAAHIQINSQPSITADQILLNTQKQGSPLGVLKFRQALNIGINREEIIKAAGVTGVPLGQFMPSEVPGYVPKLTAPTQDVAEAKTLLTDSGVKNATLTLSYGTDSSSEVLLTELQKECQALGITIKLDPIDDIDALVAKYQQGQTDMMFIGNSTTLFDGSDVLNVFQNPGVYDNTTVDQLIAQSNQTLDGAKHLALLQQAAETLHDDVGAIPLYSRADNYAQTSNSYRLTNEIPGVQASAYFWKVYQ